MNDDTKIILASTSPSRRALLENAGLAFEAVAPEIDERAVETTLETSRVAPEDVATILAEAKAQEVSDRFPGAWVIGGDQTLSLGDEVLHKPPDMEAARRRLLALSGHIHQLSTSVVLARDGETEWRHTETARLAMRELDPAFIGRHLSHVGDKALSSVGAYQFEGEGIQLFERIDGDYFAILGLPLLPLLKALREREIIDG